MNNDTQGQSATASTARPPHTLRALVSGLAAHGQRRAILAFGRDGVQSLSYAELADVIARTAHGLAARGVGPGQRVALLGPNDPRWIIAYFAIVSAGGVAVPLDPQSTKEATAAALARAEARALITTRTHRDALGPLTNSPLRIWLLDDTGDDSLSSLASGAEQSELHEPTGSDLASLLFTSGTTGTPKAVPLTHDNLTGNVGELLAARLIAADDRVLLPLPLHHTYPFTAGLLLTLATGGTIVLPAGMTGPDILEACRRGRPTALLAVPRLCTAIWDSVQSQVDARGRFARYAFAALLEASIAVRRNTGLHIGRWLFRPLHTRLGGALELIGCGGAKLPGELAWRLEGLGFRVLTGYGLTETSPVLTFNNPEHSKLGSEGQPLPGVELRIAAAQDDTPGEILARGPGVFGGYWHDSKATAAAFTADGWFRTGDLGRIDDEGYLYVVGRSKELIVLADGKKFFPETVEKEYAASTLLREVGIFEHDGLLAAVVVPDEDELRRRGTLAEAAALRSQLEDVAARLPPYQRLSSYRIVRSPLPRTQLGKLRRHLLPAVFDGAVVEASSDATVPSEADNALLSQPLGRDVWAWLQTRYPDRRLTLDTSPQLELMIDSLGWVALTVEIERRFGVALNADQLAHILTLRDLLREIETGRPASANRTGAPEFARPGPLLRALGALLLVLIRTVAHLTLRPTVTGLEHLPRGPALIAPNHSSYLDPVAVATALPWHRLRRTYWAGWAGVMHNTAIRRLVSRATQVFPVDPDRDLAAAVRTARSLLADGYDVVWFPEGRRSPNGELQELQAGIGLLTEGMTTAVVPVAIGGTFEAWPKHRRWPRPAHVSIAFGQAIEVAAGAKPEEIRRTLQNAQRRLLNAIRERGSDRSS